METSSTVNEIFSTARKWKVELFGNIPDFQKFLKFDFCYKASSEEFTKHVGYKGIINTSTLLNFRKALS